MSRLRDAIATYERQLSDLRDLRDRQLAQGAPASMIDRTDDRIARLRDRIDRARSAAEDEEEPEPHPVPIRDPERVQEPAREVTHPEPEPDEDPGDPYWTPPAGVVEDVPVLGWVVLGVLILMMLRR